MGLLATKIAKSPMDSNLWLNGSDGDLLEDPVLIEDKWADCCT